MMNKFKLSVLTIFLLSISLPRIQAQTNVRAYEKWEATQFVAVSGHQPEDYVLADNNWEIIYNLRTPHTLNELLKMGVKCSDSQLLLLEVGGDALTSNVFKSNCPVVLVAFQAAYVPRSFR